MTTVGITGGLGFLGWHLRCKLLAAGVSTVIADRTTFADSNKLTEFCRNADVILHVAGVNRASTDDEVATGNRTLATALAEAIQASGAPTPVLYTNSTHSLTSAGAYGESKRQACDILAAQCERNGSPFLNLVLPHVYGEFGRPHYNSVVATFANALATGQPASVNRDGVLELVHAQDVAEVAMRFVSEPKSETLRLRGDEITVGDLWDRLQALANRYTVDATMPCVDDRLSLGLFNTLRAQLFEAGYYPVALQKHTDQRGAFVELCRADGTGQTSLSTSHPGVVRGDHFHFDKVERFVVVQGTAELQMRRLFDTHVRQVRVSGDQPVVVDMPPLVTHNITNTGDDLLITAFWAGDHFDPNVPDTYAHPVSAAT